MGFKRQVLQFGVIQLSPVRSCTNKRIMLQSLAERLSGCAPAEYGPLTLSGLQGSTALWSHLKCRERAVQRQGAEALDLLTHP